MTKYDCLVIGAGFTGSALAYELAQRGYRVLLLDKDSQLQNATEYSYGGLAYWSGTDTMTRQLCQEGREIHQHLSQELGHETEFRDIDLLLTIPKSEKPEAIYQNYQHFALVPELLSPQEAAEVEPLLNREAIAGVLKLPHAHIHAQKTSQAYQSALECLGGKILYEGVETILKDKGRVTGIKTAQNTYYAPYTIVCAGGLTRQLLQEAEISINQYFTYAQLIKTPPQTQVRLRTLIMSAIPSRLRMEKALDENPEAEKWQQPTEEIVASALEAGAIQFQDHSFCLGQLSQIIRAPGVILNAQESERQIRQAVGQILPELRDIPGQWYQCLVAFAQASRPLVGSVTALDGLYLFSGFTSTLIFAPPLARRFAAKLSQSEKFNLLGDG